MSLVHPYEDRHPAGCRCTPGDGKEKPASGSAAKTEERGYLSSPVAAIPTSHWLSTTFLVATIAATIEPGGDKRLFMRWVIYAVMIVVIVLWLGSSYLRNSNPQKKRAFPWLETASAVVAFAAWGLAMPEAPLNAVLSRDNRTIWTGNHHCGRRRNSRHAR